MKQTCVQCRSRKVRCDGQQAGCRNCLRLGFDCSFQNGPASTRVIKLRTRNACLQCRSQKIKCSGETPTCANRIRKKKRCSLATASTSVGTPENDDQATQEQSLGSTTAVQHGAVSQFSNAFAPPTGIELSRMIDDYFYHVHALAMYAFLHPATTKQRCIDGALDEYLCMAMCAITALKLNIARFYPKSSDAWIQQAEDMIWKDIETPSVTRLQALLFIISYRIETEKPAKAFMLAALAARMSSALHLNYENKDLGPIPREVRRRLVWSLAVLDGYFAIGVPEYEVSTFENVFVQLPCNEVAFAAGEAVRTENLRPSGRRHISNLGCMAYIIRLASMRRDVMRLNRQLALSEGPVPDLADLVHRFKSILQQIESDLNTGHSYSRTMIEQAVQIGWVSRYITAHLSLHQAHCDLFRLFLRGYSEAAPESILVGVSNDLIEDATSRCLGHALAMVTIFRDVQECCKTWTLMEVDNAICAYHAARLVLYISSSDGLGSSASNADAMDQAHFCLSFAKRFFDSCSFTKPIIDDLQHLIVEASDPDSNAQNRALSYHNLSQWNNAESTLPRDSQKHQRLAIHSLLRRSHFRDEIEEPEFTVSSPASTFHSANEPRSARLRLQE